MLLQTCDWCHNKSLFVCFSLCLCHTVRCHSRREMTNSLRCLTLAEMSVNEESERSTCVEFHAWHKHLRFSFPPHIASSCILLQLHWKSTLPPHSPVVDTNFVHFALNGHPVVVWSIRCASCGEKSCFGHSLFTPWFALSAVSDIHPNNSQTLKGKQSPAWKPC